MTEAATKKCWHLLVEPVEGYDKDYPIFVGRCVDCGIRGLLDRFDVTLEPFTEVA